MRTAGKVNMYLKAIWILLSQAHAFCPDPPVPSLQNTQEKILKNAFSSTKLK